jgi:hypothetical protein
MEPIKLLVNVGKYTFQITDNTLSLEEQIYCRNFKIGGNISECVYVSIAYNDNQPISASIPHIVYDPDCSIDTPLEHGNGSVIMIQTLLKHIHQQIPTLSEVNFQDNSHIECATESEIHSNLCTIKTPPKGTVMSERGNADCSFLMCNCMKGSIVYPIPLYYFSIAFNGVTWYEKHFNARQKDSIKHNKYREKIKTLLYSEEIKAGISFIQFLQMAQPPIEITHELEPYYSNSLTFGNFFQSIPKVDRCRLVRDWISTFMTYHLNDVFENTDWVIELPITPLVGGGKRNTRKYYCPKNRIRYNKTYKDFGVRALDM